MELNKTFSVNSLEVCTLVPNSSEFLVCLGVKDKIFLGNGWFERLKGLFSVFSIQNWPYFGNFELPGKISQILTIFNKQTFLNQNKIYQFINFKQANMKIILLEKIIVIVNHSFEIFWPVRVRNYS